MKQVNAPRNQFRFPGRIPWRGSRRRKGIPHCVPECHHRKRCSCGHSKTGEQPRSCLLEAGGERMQPACPSAHCSLTSLRAVPFGARWKGLSSGRPRVSSAGRWIFNVHPRMDGHQQRCCVCSKIPSYRSPVGWAAAVSDNAITRWPPGRSSDLHPQMDAETLKWPETLKKPSARLGQS